MRKCIEKILPIVFRFFVFLFLICVFLIGFQLVFSERAVEKLIPYAGVACILYLSACFLWDFLFCGDEEAAEPTPVLQAETVAEEKELDPRCRTSYLKVISALCNIKREIDPSSREASGILASQSQRDNLALSHATIKNIFREVEEIRKNRKSK